MISPSLPPTSSTTITTSTTTSSPPLQFLLNSVPDLTAISFISTLLLLSLFSLFFIVHFRLKSHQSQHLKDFNSLWTVRILFVLFISLWALNDLIRLPSFPPKFIPSSSSSSLTLDQKTNFCKTHVVLSQGFFQPGFLITLLFLVNISVMKRNPNNTLRRAIVVVFSVCLPLISLQIFFLFYSSHYFPLPDCLLRSFLVYRDQGFEVEENGDGDGDGNGDSGGMMMGNDKVLCTYPLISTIIFGSFAIIYLIFFAFACWRVVSVVINKGLRVRIYLLAFTVLITIPIQLMFLISSAFWKPGDVAFDGIGLVVFLSVLLCAVVGEGILVIRPIADALAVGGEFYRSDTRDSRRL